MSRGEDFWSRRRAGVAVEEQTEISAKEDAERQALEAEKTDEELLEELGLPEPESMQAGDDFSVFMSNVVPDRLRRRALRILWRSNPILANVDNLVDYGEDFTDAATVIENLQTTYQVGKGMLRHVERTLELAAEKEAQISGTSPEEDDLRDDSEVELEEEAITVPEVEVSTDDALLSEYQDESPMPQMARRMQFSFEDVDTRQSA
ncbi:MAG: DUF3306 domain-containing protein [Litoreibacter sp.]